MAVSKIFHKGKEIVYIYYRGLQEQAMIEAVKKAESILLLENKPQLVLANLSNAFATPGFMEVNNTVSKNIKHLIEKGAVVGITGAKSILLKGYNLIIGGKMNPFSTEEEAKDYLVK
ncbi:MAG TPA: hypothetical protein DDX98_00125 [Bacteroidales bacterium]|jgi:hypothetical protein|nr:hypothetical protein [Bacteroidales bacterium]